MSAGCRRARGGETRNGGQHERDVEPEDHTPARDMSERAAEQRPDAEAKHQEPGPSADRCCPALRCRAAVDRGQRARHRERRREALQGPPGQQRSLRAGSGNDAGRDAEQRQSDHRCSPRAEPVRRLSAEHDEDRGDDQIGVDRPFHAGWAEEKLDPHVRQGGHDCRAVGADREHRQTRRPQDRREPCLLFQRCCVLSLVSSALAGQHRVWFRCNCSETPGSSSSIRVILWSAIRLRTSVSQACGSMPLA